MHNATPPALEISRVSMDFGGLRALDHVDIEVHPRETAALIGPNGAGKTTLFNCITGIYTPTSGSVRLTPAGRSAITLKGLKPNKVTECGIARTFQNIRLFQNMTVLENVMIGRHCRLRSGIVSAILRTRAMRREEQQAADDSYQLLRRFGLAAHVNEFAKNLPYGAQRRLEIARAMATEPSVLLLDEPAAGMNAQETQELVEMIFQLKESEGLAIFLIEHDMRLVMQLSDRIYVMDYGKLIAQGTPEEVSHHPEVIKAYLGEDNAIA